MTTTPKKTLDAPHKIISVTLLPTGRLILATDNRIYDLVNNVWEPMIFAADPVLDPVAPVTSPTHVTIVTPGAHDATKPGLFGAPATPVVP